MLCRDLRALPNAGGILDQDSYQMFLIKSALPALAEADRRAQEKLRQSQGHK